MAKRVQLRRGTTAQTNAFTGAVGEVTVDTDKKTVVVHDGTTAGGTPLARVSEVPSLVPQATETVAGKAKIATTAIAQAGTNGTDIITPATLKGCLDTKVLGINQTWQNVTSSRVSGTTYTNSTTRPIGLYIYTGTSVSTLVVGGVTFSTYGYSMIQVVIPIGSTYSFNGSFGSWLELR